MKLRFLLWLFTPTLVLAACLERTPPRDASTDLRDVASDLAVTPDTASPRDDGTVPPDAGPDAHEEFLSADTAPEDRSPSDALDASEDLPARDAIATMDVAEEHTRDDVPGDTLSDTHDGPDPIYSPVPVSIVRVFAAFEHTYATARDGTLWAWGSNGAGMMQPAELSGLLDDNRLRPQLITGVTGVQELQSYSASGLCVLAGPMSGGAVYCWGRGAFRAYGAGRLESWNLWRYPRRMGTFSDVTSLTQYGGCIRSDQRYWEFDSTDPNWVSTFSINERWGGRLVRGVPDVFWVTEGVVASALAESEYEQGLQRIDGITDLVGGLDHTCMLLSTGRVMCWGANDYGQAGNFALGGRCRARTTDGGLPAFDATYCVRPPTEVSDLTDVVRITAGTDATCAVRRDGTVWCWGINPRLGDGLGMLGDGRAPDETCGVRLGVVIQCRTRPVRVVGIDNAVDVSMGSGHTCAVLATGEVRCWGYNDHGELGDGTTVSRGIPAPVRWN